VKRSFTTLAAGLGLALLLSGPLSAQQVMTGTMPAISAEDLRTRLGIIADDSMMGREAGQQGNYQATSYIAAEVQRMGLEPGGEDGSYFQVIPLRDRRLDERSVLAVHGSQLKLWSDFAPLRPVGSLPIRTEVAFAEVAVVYGGRLGTADLLEAAGAKDAVVLLDAPRDSAGTAQFSFQAVVSALQRYRETTALLIVGLDVMPGGTLRFLRRPALFLESGETDPSGPGVVFIRRQVADDLFSTPLSEVAPGTEAPPLEGRYGFVTTDPEAPARNVVAILPGSDSVLRHEYVLIGAHNDHVGTGQPVDHDSLRIYNTMVRPWGASTRNPQPPTEAQWAEINTSIDSVRRLRPARLDSIFNGADDDGSGTVAVLEIAEAFAAAPERPRRSVIFMWHTAEEKGLLGSQYFSEHPTVPREAIVTALNMDMVGRGQPTDPAEGPYVIQIIGSRRLSTQLGDVIETVNSGEGHVFSFDYSFDATGHPQQRYCRSDHYMYARYGIPISYFSAGYHPDYHQLTDEVRYINFPHMEAFAGLLYDIVAAVAALDERPVVDHEVPPIADGCRQ